MRGAALAAAVLALGAGVAGGVVMPDAKQAPDSGWTAYVPLSGPDTNVTVAPPGAVPPPGHGELRSGDLVVEDDAPSIPLPTYAGWKSGDRAVIPTTQVEIQVIR